MKRRNFLKMIGVSPLAGLGKARAQSSNDTIRHVKSIHEIPGLLPPNEGKQVRFLNSNKPFICWVDGMGAGKTTAGVFKGLRNSWVYTDNRGLVVAPDDGYLRYLKACFQRSIGLKATSDYPYHLVVPGTNSTIQFVSAQDLDEFRVTIQGLRLGWAWIDNAHEFDNDDVAHLLIQRLRIADILDVGLPLQVSLTASKQKQWIYDRFYRDGHEEIYEGI